MSDENSPRRLRNSTMTEGASISLQRANVPHPLARQFERAGLDWIVPDWPAPANVHGFVTTRNGGVSTGRCASLDLGLASDTGSADEVAAIAENRRRVLAFLPSSPAWLAQVHGAEVVDIDRLRSRALPRADAAVTRRPNIVLAVRIADCMPVLFADRASPAIGVAHAGWRGLAAGVLENTIAAMRCTPSRIVAWLGPAIGCSAFEVGADVRDAFLRSDRAAEGALTAHGRDKWLADLEALARMRLARAGVTDIHGGGLCTASDAARFFSFRRDGTSGRMGAFLWRADA